jgi:acetate kinase
VILTVNAGSSSVRLALFDERGEKRARRHLGAGESPKEVLSRFLDDGAPGRKVVAVAHRVVHGGPLLAAPCVVDPRIEEEIEALAPLAPLHQPAALAWLRAARALVGPEVPEVAVFDTGFFSDLPLAARTYALPRELRERHRLRRYGFHGLAHQMMARSVAPRSDGKLTRAITFQLGSGCSAAAIVGGRPIDTSMGWSALEGLVMATRSGDLDPGLLIHLVRDLGYSPEDLDRMLNYASGLLGLCGSSEMRAILARDDAPARLAVELFCQRAKKYLGAFLAELGGADAIVFGGGIGENAPEIRARIAGGLESFGVVLDPVANAQPIARQARVSAPRSAVTVQVVAVDEEQILYESARPFVRT